MNYNHFSDKIIEWYECSKRALPWRETNDPYLIWLSEIILQQTRVSQGLPYFFRFLQAFPTINDLAEAEEKEVLRLWQGLGYYSRARNMHKSAQHVVEKMNGIFPRSYNEILNLKGVGKYTAGAIASFAFNERVPVVDGNVMRLLSRRFGIYEDISTQNGQKHFFILAEKLLPGVNSSTFNQAIMEFGAIICTPKLPKCQECVFNDVCHANLKGNVSELPVKLSKIKKKTREISFFIIKAEGKLLMHERKANDIWKGLFQFYSIEKHFQNKAAFPYDPVLEFIVSNSETKQYKFAGTQKHILTHQLLNIQYWQLDIESMRDNSLLEESDLRFYSMEEIKELPKPVPILNYLDENFF